MRKLLITAALLLALVPASSREQVISLPTGNGSNTPASVSAAINTALSFYQLEWSATPNVPAAGTSLATATALTTNENEITSCAGGGVSLPVNDPVGAQVIVDDRCTVPTNVYPDSTSHQIESNANGVPVVIDANSDNRFVKISPTQWLQ